MLRASRSSPSDQQDIARTKGRDSASQGLSVGDCAADLLREHTLSTCSCQGRLLRVQRLPVCAHTSVTNDHCVAPLSFIDGVLI